MKKAAILFITALSIVAVVIVGFIGSDLSGIYPKVYFTSLSILSCSGKEAYSAPSGKKIIRLDFYHPENEAGSLKKDEEGRNYLRYAFVTKYTPDDFNAMIDYRTKKPKVGAYEYKIPEYPYISFDTSDENARFLGVFNVYELSLEDLQSEYDKDAKMFDAQKDVPVDIKANDGSTASDEIYFSIHYRITLADYNKLHDITSVTDDGN